MEAFFQVRGAGLSGINAARGGGRESDSAVVWVWVAAVLEGSDGCAAGECVWTWSVRKGVRGHRVVPRGRLRQEAGPMVSEKCPESGFCLVDVD